MNLREREFFQPLLQAVQKDGMDKQYAVRIIIQYRDGAFGDVNKYHAAEKLTPEERAICGWNIDNHPRAISLLVQHWVESGAAKRFAEEHPWEEFDPEVIGIGDLSILLN